LKTRLFGSTGLELSEVGFGGWGIGGESYGAVEPAEALRALARAEELGCNFVDTAQVYGASEDILGEFLVGRRDRWSVATKYSGQPEGLVKTAESQLRRLGISEIDFYQIHWVPHGDDAGLFDDLQSLKDRGLAKAVGVSLYTVNDVDRVLARGDLDGVQLPFSLLEPEPFLSRVDALRRAGLGVLVRSSLKGGLLSGKYDATSRFEPGADQRSAMGGRALARTLRQVEAFRFLEEEAGSLAAGAARYPLSFPEVSAVLLGTKSADQSRENFGDVPGQTLSLESLRRISAIQRRLRVGRDGIGARLRSRVTGLLKRTVRGGSNNHQ
jgi:aryl-alcohol dehydrogenase-like predicted oxidoreductase